MARTKKTRGSDFGFRLAQMLADAGVRPARAAVALDAPLTELGRVLANERAPFHPGLAHWRTLARLIDADPVAFENEVFTAWKAWRL